MSPAESSFTLWSHLGRSPETIREKIRRLLGWNSDDRLTKRIYSTAAASVCCTLTTRRAQREKLHFCLTNEEIVGNAERVSMTFEALPRVVKPGNRLFLNDGLVQLVVDRVAGNDVQCTVGVGGELRSRKGLNLPGIGREIVLVDLRRERAEAEANASRLAEPRQQRESAP